MPNTRLKSITVKAFRSFAEESTVHFPETGMMLFKGLNADTGGSSGSGKSSLLLAISYLFGFCRFPATALQSWLTDEPMEVMGVVQVPDGELVISRGQKLGLTLNGVRVPGSAKQLEEKISQLVGLAPPLLAALTYRGQKQPGLFLDKSDGEKKEFLTVLLDLGRFETAIKKSQARSKDLEQAHNTVSYVATELHRKLEGHRASFRPAALQSEAAVERNLAQARANRDRLHQQILDLRLKLRSHEVEIERRAHQVREEATPRVKEIEARIRHLMTQEPDTSCVDLSCLVQLGADLEQAESFLKEELAADQVRYRLQRGQADSVYAQLLLLEKHLAARPNFERMLAKLQSEIKDLDKSLCPTCERQWDDAGARAGELRAEVGDVTKALAELTDMKPKVVALQAECNALSEFVPNPTIEELRSIVSKLTADIGAEKVRVDGQVAMLWLGIKDRVAEAQADLQRVREFIASEIDLARHEALESLQGDQDALEVLERELAMADSQIKGFEAALTRLQIDNVRETARVAQLESTIRTIETELEQARERQVREALELNAELDFQRMIGREGFLGAIFDEVLWEISQETNRLLAQFPNTAHVTLNFQSETTTQTDTVKKAIVPVVTVGGNEAPLRSGLSGGMETAVELAVDLAVATVVSQRTGAMPGWLVLDESFTGLGPVEAEASMEILRAFAENKLVLVVDHASEFKAMFTQAVTVQFSGGRSRVEAPGA